MLIKKYFNYLMDCDELGEMLYVAGCQLFMCDFRFAEFGFQLCGERR